MSAAAFSALREELAAARAEADQLREERDQLRAELRGVRHQLAGARQEAGDVRSEMRRLLAWAHEHGAPVLPGWFQVPVSAAAAPHGNLVMELHKLRSLVARVQGERARGAA